MSAAGDPIVVRTRLRPPVPSPHEIRRSRLLARLDQATEPVVLVAAPRGSGKTVLLAQWVGSHPDRRWAWLSLSRYDDSASGFWSGLLEAVRPLCPDTPAPPAVLLEDAGVLLRDVVPRLLNELAEAAPLTLVLDGLDAVDAPLTRTSLDAFVPRLPDTVRLVVATARPPGGPIAALRAAGRLCELGESDLRFSRAETRTLLESVAARSVPADQVTAVHGSMDGWAAGLRLSALDLRRDGAVAASDQPAPGVVDYLRAEVLERVTSAERRFLLETGVLDALDPPLCAAVTGADAGRVLEDLAASSSLVRRGADGVLRYHPALRATLRQVLGAERPELVPTLHARAAEALHRRACPDAALRHAIACGDPHLIATVVAGGWAATPPRALLRRLGRVPPAVLDVNPGLRRIAAAAELAAGDWATAQRLIRDMATSAADPEADAALSAMLHLRRGELVAPAAAPPTAVLDPDRPWASLADAAVGRALLWAGELVPARSRLAEAATAARTSRCRFAEVTALEAAAVCAALLGNTAEAERLAGEAMGSGGPDCRPPLAQVLLAARAADRAAPDAAARARNAEAALIDIEPHAEAYAWSVLAAAAHRVGDRPRERLARARAAAALAGRDPGPLLRGLLAASTTTPPVPGSVAAGAALSPRELAVLRALRGPLTLREIAAELHLSTNTVKTHVRAVFAKLGVHDRAGAVAAAGAVAGRP